MGTLEHRKLIRADVVVRVVYATGKKPAEGFAYSKDLSTTGINIIMPNKLAKDTKIELEIYFAGETRPAYASGKVVWQAPCSYIPDSNKRYYSTGIQFGEMSPADAIRTSDFVKDILRTYSEVQTKKIIGKIEEEQ